jgi:tetratricopeptide (TPR) repeat protein
LRAPPMTSTQKAIRAAANGAWRGPDALYAAAIALWRESRRDEAVKLMDEALRLRPDFADALCMGGYMLSESGKPEPAMRFYRRALELDASLVVAHLNFGKLLFAAGRFQEALARFSDATILAPYDPDAWCSRAGALRELGRLEESVEAAERALELRHDFPEAAINLGNALLKLDRSAEALEAYFKASALGPCQAKALLGQGLALRSLGRFSEAMAAFDASAALGSGEAVAGRGCLMLTLGDFENGLEGYEARWLKGKSIAEALGTRFETWKGPGQKAKRVLVLNDHGLGDTIQFFRYLPLMAAVGVDATFVCPPRLRRLLSSKANARFVDSPPQGEPFDAQIAISSLPHAFGTRLETIPAAVPYLATEPPLCEMWLKRIGAEGFKIGVVWQGNPDPEADRARSMPLAALAPLAEVAGVRLISLQKGFGEEQLASLPPSIRVETLGPNFDAGADAFVDTAAAMACLDLIITCDTSIAHLAGALAVPVWVALKRDAEWRWLAGRADSPWYPTMRLFRQMRRGVWSEVFEAMADELAKLVERRAARRMASAPCSLGELIDKITILRIKAERIRDPQKLANVHRELKLLERLACEDGARGSSLDVLTNQLAHVNARLWTIEDALRACEREGDFGPRFVALARSVYCENDTRAAIKRAINTLMSSALVEEKSYG